MFIIFINFTNHPSAKWSLNQLENAEIYGDITDIPFPEVSPDGDENYILQLSNQYIAEILKYNPDAVLCQGEMTLAFRVANLLIHKGIIVLAACSKRIVTEKIGVNGETIKNAEFNFTRFRKYE